MSPAEARFVQLMGGTVKTTTRIKARDTGFPLTYYWNLGRRLKAEGFRREVRYGPYFVDFANDLNRIIEIDGSQYHMDVVADMDREIYIRELCYKWHPNREARILRVPAYRLGLDSRRVQDDVLKFIQ
jgi:very-short-patch-repair endonuclease